MNKDILTVLQQNYLDDPKDLQRYLDDAFGLLHYEAQERGIEFNGYFQSKWEASANTVFNFDENYFADLDRRNLYVYKAAEIDSELFELFQEVYRIAQLPIPTMKDIARETFWLEEKGVHF